MLLGASLLQGNPVRLLAERSGNLPFAEVLAREAIEK
jgi:hypothetical protein